MDGTPAADFAAATQSLTKAEGVLFAILAINDPLYITAWCESATLAGVRDTPTRALSTATLRPVVERLIELGLTRSDDGRYRCGFNQRALAMRWAAARPDFEMLANRSYARGYHDPVVEARIAIFGQQPDALERLEQLAAIDRGAAETLALEVTEPFDARWLEALPAPLARKLEELAMVGLERRPALWLSLYRHFAADVARLAATSTTTVAAFAGVAAERGDLALLRALESSALPAGVRGFIRVALAIIEGRYGEASKEACALPDPKRGDHVGVLFFLAVMALRLETPISERISKWITFGGKKGASFQQTFRVLDAVASSALMQGPTSVSYARDVAADPLTGLCQSMVPSDPSLESYRIARLVESLQPVADAYSRGGLVWLSEQYGQALWSLYGSLPEGARSLVDTPPDKPKLTVGPSLLGAKTTRERWELQLDRLESLAGRVKPSGDAVAETAAPERILWRTSGQHGDLEPYVQKRAAGGKWTAGRKLAIKHLLGKSPMTARLPPEDQRVAAHAREDRQSSYGYPVVHHYMHHNAWLDLVGHPRVYFEQEEHARQVVRGEPRLSVAGQGDVASVVMSPPDLRPGVNVRAIGEQLVVFRVDAALRDLLDALAKRLEVPQRGKERLLSILERLAPLVPIESTEQTSASVVPADLTPYARLIPSRGGLAVSLLFRPLGPGSALVTPGRGAPTLIGQVGDATVQAERDLAREEAVARGIVEKCAVLEGCETGAFVWHIEEPVSCLALVSTLRDLGEAVRVEWPHGTALRVRARIGRRALRGRLERAAGFFSLEGALAVDGELSLELEQVLELLAQHPGRFVQLASGEYVELEQELRDVLDAIAAARRDDAAGSSRVAIPQSAISVLDQLTREGGALTLDQGSTAWRERFVDVFDSTPRIPRGFAGELRDYQVDGFRWLARLADLELGACLADDMGLGKTVQLVALLLHRAASGPALVVAPTSVCEGWKREIERFAPSLSVRTYWGSARDGTLHKLSRRDVVVTSYALLQQDAAELQAIEWSTAILDEAQLIKNPETLRAKAAFGLKARARVVATGTPVENHAGDLYSLFHFLNPGLLGSYKAFSAAIGSGSRGFKRLITPFVLRRTKAQVLDDLPPVTEIQRTVLLTPGEAKLYESVRKAALRKLEDGGAGGKARVAIFAELTRLRRLCCHPQLVSPNADLTSSKLQSFLDLVEELVAARHRTLVFSQFTDVLALVRPLLEAKGITYQYLDGSTPPKQRAAAVDAFQDGEGDVFLISLKAGGFGLNLTAADYVIHLDPWWNPAVEAQASDRAHRIGQTRPVTVYRLVTQGTIESRIVELHREKRELADAVLAETDRAAKLTAAEIRALLEG